jgi:UDP-glucose 4-epimerase
MKILITGGAGFIGSHLAERCLREGWRVAIIDDLSTGSFENIAHLKTSHNFNYLIDTVFNQPVVSELIDCADFVFHLAAAVGVRFIVESPVHTIETNVHGTETVLKAAAKKRKPVMITSTSEVYGKSNAIPFREDTDLVLGSTAKARWSYACSKALDEFLGLAYWREKGVPVTIVRLFNTVGPRQTGRYGMVLPTFVQQAVMNEPITVYGTGDQSRCFGYVSDVVDAMVALAKKGAPGEIVNIGNDQETTIRDLAKLVKERSGSCSVIRFLPYESVYGSGFEDMQRRVPSLEKLERLVGFRPRTPIEVITEVLLADARVRLFEQAVDSHDLVGQL